MLPTRLAWEAAAVVGNAHLPTGVTASTATAASAKSAVTVSTWRATDRHRGVPPEFLFPLCAAFTVLGYG